MRRSWSVSITTTVTACLAVVIFLATAQTSLAQRYLEQQPKLNEKEAKALIRDLTAIFRGNGMTAANKQVLDQYFKGWYFPSMTSQSPQALGELAEKRENFFKRNVNLCTNKEARDYLIDTAGREMGKIALQNYHPATRYNAVLLIGLLNEEPGGSGRNAKPPVPWKQGTSVLLKLLEKDSFGSGENKVMVPMSAKVGALVGLQRHARFGIDQAQAEQLNQAAMKMVNTKEGPTGTDPDVHAWVRCLAARVLITQAAEGANQPVVDAVTLLVADPALQLDDRCYAASLMKRLEFEGSASLDVKPTVLALASLTDSVMQDEAKKAKKYQQKIFGGNRGAAFGGGRGGGFGGGEYGGGYGGGGLGGARGKQEPKYEIRRLLDRVYGLTDAMKQVAKASPEAQNTLDPLLDPLDSLAKQAIDKDAIVMETATNVISLSKEMSRLSAAMQPADPAAQPPAEDEGFEEAAPAEEPVAAAG
ncbi:hypothetical protein [Adhaeretor mobilis]|uniref:Uncharacterized protein n=1 Tax=Adhaeretor mobilis TaxID=1930276 RepID=A0A517MPI9_9BACT|nr:hypothetical protein [Adhaeretor mobilis]QDS96782.1 hypothetical protein HG15A2_00400 [Adhaeretor mobilis]